jgi:hypothetical protein
VDRAAFLLTQAVVELQQQHARSVERVHTATALT